MCVTKKPRSSDGNTMGSAGFYVDNNAFLPYDEQQTDMWITLFLKDTEMWKDKVDGSSPSDPNL
jgi:hypothetical protein